MDISRRSFLGGALALSAAVALPGVALASVPTIYGDGQHDDTVGLQALFDGKPFRVASGGPFAWQSRGRVTLSGGSFKVSETIHVRRTALILNASFDGREIAGDRPVIYISGHGSTVRGSYAEASILPAVHKAS